MDQEKLEVKLSIIIPVYNTELYLERCLNSIINCLSKFDNTDFIEILILNDGSPDNSQKIIDIYKAKYNFIKSYINVNVGLSETRNIGLTLAKGLYIWFIDSDDYIKKIDLYQLILFISRNDIDVCYFKYREGTEVVVENLGLELDTTNILTGDAFFSTINFTGHSWLYIVKKNIIGNVRFDIGKYYEDIAFTVEILSKADKFYYIDEEIYEYFFNASSIIRKKNDYSKDYKLCDDLVFACNRIQKILDEKGHKLSEAKIKGIETRLENLVYFLISTIFLKNLTYKDLKRIIRELNFKKFKHLTDSKLLKNKIVSKIFNNFFLKECFFYLISLYSKR